MQPLKYPRKSLSRILPRICNCYATIAGVTPIGSGVTGLRPTRIGIALGMVLALSLGMSKRNKKSKKGFLSSLDSYKIVHLKNGTSVLKK